ncbi:hypothetical protein GALMADRAFT_1196040 [Galerina marginata CBS 339.88]|uniref:Uncharacterized protein n=1 Tax=Galerina marginata (strain CBS 339.88) TaxID=685588 RepID=A0A067TB80_GALM3|nr:hypothetical protein GALMADRAFT_1196040 [Galerina marginata CBS 339.88]
MTQATRQGGGIFGTGNNFLIVGGTFYEVNETQNANLAMQPHEAVKGSKGAMHDSAERYPAGRCHRGTREESTNAILDWIIDQNPTYDVLWLYWPAGAGKSAIMKTI